MKVVRYYCDRCGTQVFDNPPQAQADQARFVLRVTRGGETVWNVDLCVMCQDGVQERIEGHPKAEGFPRMEGE